MSEVEDRLVILTFRHLDGILSADEAVELNHLLRTQPKDRERFLAIAGQEALLTEVVPGARRASGQGGFPVRWVVSVAAAAVLVLGVVLGWQHLASEPIPTTPLHMTEVRGQVRIWRDGVALPGVQGVALLPRDRLEVVDGSCRLAWSDEDSRIEMVAPARLRIDQGWGAKRFHLDGGYLAAEVASQAPETGLHITSPHAEARVIGTGFQLTVTQATTTLSVTHGIVSFTCPVAVIPTRVTAGRSMVTDGRTPPTDVPRPPSTNVVNTDTMPRHWSITSEDALTGRGRDWTGIPTPQGVRPRFDGKDQLISIPSTKSGLIAAGPGLTARVHVEADVAGTLAVMLVILDPDGNWLGNMQAERTFLAETPQEVVVVWEDFRLSQGQALTRLATGVVGQVMVLSWPPVEGLRLHAASLDR